jgi:predicted dehydrogenase/nucleoside-diphosphate-sugar epimerase
MNRPFLSSPSDLPASDPPIRIGLVGAGKMGRHHLAALRHLHPLVSVSAVADPTIGGLEAAATLSPGVRTYGSLEEMLRGEQLEAVHICTAPATHFDLARTAIEAGAHIYVEKPWAESVSQARTLLDLAGAAGTKICAGHQLLFEPPSLTASTLLPAVGEVVHVESHFSFRSVRRSSDGRTPLRADLQLLDILPHPVYLLLRFLRLGHPEQHARLAALEVGPGGTVHALVRRGALVGTLLVTLDGRPVDSYVRIVGRNGSLHADFVRGTVQRCLGPGVSAVDKVLHPYRLAGQLVSQTSGSLVRRMRSRHGSYPGLREIFQAFYGAIATGAPSPTPTGELIEGVEIWSEIAEKLSPRPTRETAPAVAPPAGAARVAVTGGTGLIGRAVVSNLRESGVQIRVLARSIPVDWERMDGVEYHVSDLGEAIPPDLLQGVAAVVHCAAETSGGWDQHARNSVQAAENLVRAAAAAGVSRLVHVSSMAVLEAGRSGVPLSEGTPLDPRARDRGPYVWGKAESERRVLAAAGEAGLEVRIVRPGAVVDDRNYQPPGRLGKRLGNLFVAVGGRRDLVGVATLSRVARVIAWTALHFERTPGVLNLLDPAQPTREELVDRLRLKNPDLTVVWVPGWLLASLSPLLSLAQRALRPGKPVIDVAGIFASQEYDLARIESVERMIEGTSPGAAIPAAPEFAGDLELRDASVPPLVGPGRLKLVASVPPLQA